jgi:hypothetical protein
LRRLARQARHFADKPVASLGKGFDEVRLFGIVAQDGAQKIDGAIDGMIVVDEFAIRPQ